MGKRALTEEIKRLREEVRELRRAVEERNAPPVFVPYYTGPVHIEPYQPGLPSWPQYPIITCDSTGKVD